MLYRFALLMLLVALLVAGMVNAEPTRDAATSPAAIPSATTIPGTATIDPNVMTLNEWYTVTQQGEGKRFIVLERDGVYRVEAEGSNLSLFQIINSNNYLNAESRSTFDDSRKVISYFHAQDSGVYLVMVNGTNVRARVSPAVIGEVSPGVPFTGSLNGPGDEQIVRLNTTGAGIINIRSSSAVPLTLQIREKPDYAPGPLNYTEYTIYSQTTTAKLTHILMTGGKEFLLLINATDPAQSGAYQIELTQDPLSNIGIGFEATVSLTPEQPRAYLAMFNVGATLFSLKLTNKADLRLRLFNYDQRADLPYFEQAFPAQVFDRNGDDPFFERMSLLNSNFVLEISAQDPQKTLDVTVEMQALDRLTLGTTPQEVTISADYPLEIFNVPYEITQSMAIWIETPDSDTASGVIAELGFWGEYGYSPYSTTVGYWADDVLIAFPKHSPESAPAGQAVLTLRYQVGSSPAPLRLWVALVPLNTPNDRTS